MTDLTLSTSKLKPRALSGPTCHIGKVVKQRRLELGINITEFTLRTGVARSYVYAVERGQFLHPAADKLAAFALALDISTDELLSCAGLLPSPPDRVQVKPPDYLRTTFRLGPESVDRALAFIEHLQQREGSR